MTAHSRRTSAALIGLAAALGGWTAHTVIYLLRPGVDGLPDALPAGMALGLRLWMRMGQRLERATSALGDAWRGGRVGVPAGAADIPCVPARVASLAALILPAQLCLYVVQENAERASAHVPAPGLAVLDGRALLAHTLVVVATNDLLVPFLAPLARRALWGRPPPLLFVCV